MRVNDTETDREGGGREKGPSRPESLLMTPFGKWLSLIRLPRECRLFIGQSTDRWRCSPRRSVILRRWEMPKV